MNNQRILLMEGADGTGKTTLAKALSSELSIPYFKRNNEDFKNCTEEAFWKNEAFKNSLYFDQTYIAQFLKQTGYSTILDRAWPSEYVYSQVFCRNTDFQLLTELDDFYSNLRAKIIITRCRKPFREDNLVGADYFEQVRYMYNLFSQWTKCDVITLEMDRLSLDEAVNIVISSYNEDV
jgi:thymidylate kinase